MKQTIWFKKTPYIHSYSSVVGPKEANGPLGGYFDIKLKDDKNNQKTYEMSESTMQVQAIKLAVINGDLKECDIGVIISGDLTNEITCSSFAARAFPIPFLGMYDACSTFGEAVIVASALISGGFMDKAACVTSSHFSSIERQFRYPLELGTQPTPTSQWTVTGAGCSILSSQGGNIAVECATIGKVVDMGITDANNMGAAMAPAAADTMLRHLEETGRGIDYYDYIFTGDLGKFGKTLFVDLLDKAGINVKSNYNDCGAMIYDDEKSVQGASGAGCVSTVFNSFILKELMTEPGCKLLLIPTGALLSKVSSLQGETIPSVAHAVSFVNRG